MSNQVFSLASKLITKCLQQFMSSAWVAIFAISRHQFSRPVHFPTSPANVDVTFSRSFVRIKETTMPGLLLCFGHVIIKTNAHIHKHHVACCTTGIQGPAAELQSWAEGPGLRPLNIIWVAILDTSSPSSHLFLFYRFPAHKHNWYMALLHLVHVCGNRVSKITQYQLFWRWHKFQLNIGRCVGWSCR